MGHGDSLLDLSAWCYNKIQVPCFQFALQSTIILFSDIAGCNEFSVVWAHLLGPRAAALAALPNATPLSSTCRPITVSTCPALVERDKSCTHTHSFTLYGAIQKKSHATLPDWVQVCISGFASPLVIVGTDKSLMKFT